MSQRSISYAEKIIRAIAIRYEAEFKEASVKQWAKELEEYSEECLNTAFQRFKIEYESLPFRFSVAAGLLKQLRPTMTAATVENHLGQAVALLRSASGDPYGYLNSINPRLLVMAENNDLFNKVLPQDTLGIRIHKIAAQFMEEVENLSKGFEPPNPNSVQLPSSERQTKLLERKPNPYKGFSIGEAAKQAARDLAYMRAEKEKALEPKPKAV